jgi:hypothetical protein
MKLKYYMRGLGIGIILTTLILTLGNRKISDEEVVKRATALGMIFEEKEDDKLNEMLGNGEAVTPSLAPTNKPSSEPTPTVGLVQEPTPTITIAPTKAPEPTATPKPTSEPNKEQGKNKTISFTIERGMDSKEVANVLVQVGLIKDAEDFNRYIIKVGKASNIKAADFKIKENSSYDEIIKTITLK